MTLHRRYTIDTPKVREFVEATSDNVDQVVELCRNHYKGADVTTNAARTRLEWNTYDGFWRVTGRTGVDLPVFVDLNTSYNTFGVGYERSLDSADRQEVPSAEVVYQIGERTNG